jgi:hypothetical protein
LILVDDTDWIYCHLTNFYNDINDNNDENLDDKYLLNQNDSLAKYFTITKFNSFVEKFNKDVFTFYIQFSLLNKESCPLDIDFNLFNHKISIKKTEYLISYSNCNKRILNKSSIVFKYTFKVINIGYIFYCQQVSSLSAYVLIELKSDNLENNLINLVLMSKHLYYYNFLQNGMLYSLMSKNEIDLTIENTIIIDDSIIISQFEDKQQIGNTKWPIYDDYKMKGFKKFNDKFFSGTITKKFSFIETESKLHERTLCDKYDLLYVKNDIKLIIKTESNEKTRQGEEIAIYIKGDVEFCLLPGFKVNVFEFRINENHPSNIPNLIVSSNHKQIDKMIIHKSLLNNYN